MGREPVIILGMHRSGTTMLTKILEELGLFMGDQKQEDHEALFFLRLNIWIFSTVHSRWDNPYDFGFIDDDLSDSIRHVLETQFVLPRRIVYLGKEKAGQYKNIRDIDFPWGWKDPRNTFTIDVWKKMFPKAKIIHIYRNPLDVAQSLRKREVSYRENASKPKGFMDRMMQNYKIRRLKPDAVQIDSARIHNIYEGVKVWESYASKALSLDATYPKDVIHVKYEDFLENPKPELEKVIGFVGLKPETGQIDEAISQVNSERKYAFLKNEELVSVYHEIKGNDMIHKLGYDKII